MDFTPTFGCLSLCSATMQVGGTPAYIAFSDDVKQKGQFDQDFQSHLALVSSHPTTHWCKVQLDFLAGIHLTRERLENVAAEFLQLASFDIEGIWQHFTQKPALYFSAAQPKEKDDRPSKKSKKNRG